MILAGSFVTSGSCYAKAEKRVKRTAVDMSKLKADGLMVAAAYMQGLQAAVRLCEQQQQVVGQ